MEQIYIQLLVAGVYGVTMKLADLLDEHGLKWFPGSALLFGMLWGIAGSWLVWSDPVIANVVLAMNIAFIMRNRLDYFNHQLGASVIIVCFLAFGSVDIGVFGVFYGVFLVFGMLRDYVGDVIEAKNGLLALYDKVMWYYPLSTLLYALMYGDWTIFAVFLVYTIAYDGTKAVDHYVRSEG